MIPAGEVPVGMLMYRECGCSGVRFGRPDGPVTVVVQRPCAAHLGCGRPSAVTLDSWELVSPLTRAYGGWSEG